VRRVCHLLASLDFGGVERRMRILAEAAAERRGSLHFVVISGGGSARDRIVEAGHEVTCLDSKASVYSIRTFLAVLRTIRRIGPDVVHTHGAEGNFHGLPAAFLAGVPVRIGEEIGLPGHRRMARLAFRTVYRFAHRVVAVSPAVKDDLVRTGEVAPGKVVMVENPVRRVTPAVPGERGGRPRPRCCFVGRLVDWKNVRSVLDALHDLLGRGRPFDFWVVGDGPQRSELVNVVRARGLDDYVRFLGFQDRPEDCIRTCDFFILPSTEQEGFCMALVEAMAMGMPAISTRVGIAPEIISDGETGWLVPARDTGALTEKLDQVLRLPREVAAAVGAAGRRRVLARNTPTEYLRRLDALYDAVSREHRVQVRA